MWIYVIGDIYGQFELLWVVYVWIVEDDGVQGGDGQIVYVGDLIDRGFDLCGVVDYLMCGQVEGWLWIVLKGNYDCFLMCFFQQLGWIDLGFVLGLYWLDYQNLGVVLMLVLYGVECGMCSYVDVLVDMFCVVLQVYVDWLDVLLLYYWIDGVVIVYVGMWLGVVLEDQIEYDLLWIWKGFLDNVCDYGVLVVYGYMVVDWVMYFGNWLVIDIGVVYGGLLSVVVFDEIGLYQLIEVGCVLVVYEVVLVG